MSEDASPRPAALRYEASESFVRLLDKLGCSLAVSVYTAGRVALISARGDKLSVAAFAFQRPMGLASFVADGDFRLAIATFQEVVVLADAPLLAPGIPGAGGAYEHLLVPRATLYSGDIDAHDLVWIGQHLFAANTSFSCIAEIDARASFTPVWVPPFVTQLMPDDRCHLNGLASEGDRIAYATAFARSDTARGWNENRYRTGLLMEVPSGKIVLEGLCLPHSPRLFEGELYLLESGKGRVLRVDPQSGTVAAMPTLPGFTRGLDCQGDILFVGLSRLRDRQGEKPQIADGDLELICGVAAVDRRNGKLLGYLRFDDAYEEVFDVKVLPGFQRGGMLGVDGELHRRALVLPGRAFWGAPVDEARARPVSRAMSENDPATLQNLDLGGELVR